MAAKAREHVVRLAGHPSLALWCGNNENLEGRAHWGWQEKLDGRSWGAGYYFDLLPRIVAELDPTRPYWPGSPYSGTPEADPRDPSRGTIHIWTVWNERDYSHYDAYTPRFVAEFGFQGPPTYATLRRSVPDSPLTPDSPRQKARDGQLKLLRGLGDHLPRPDTFDDWHYYTQLNQARAVTYGVERFRALAPYCTGAVVWQLNDCWPVTSWAAVDGDGRRKPLWYALRRAFADRLLTVQDGRVVAVNDTDVPWTGDLILTRRRVTGEALAEERVSVTTAPRATAVVPLPYCCAVPGDPAAELLDVRLGASRALRCFAEDTAMRYAPAEFEITTLPRPGGLRLHVTAHTLVRELAIFVDRLDPDATIDDQLVTLLPGETATFNIRTQQEIDTGALTKYPLLRCINEG
nr:hypothetical protein [Streptomyces composti]